MTGRFDELWSLAADDGAFSLAKVFATESYDDVDLLLDAWYRERTDRIECSLVLDRAHRLISRLLAEGDFSPKRQRQARDVMRAIRDVSDLMDQQG